MTWNTQPDPINSIGGSGELILSTGEVVASGSTTARTLAERFGEVVNVKDYGATGDGTTDDTEAIQDAIDACTPGGTVFFPYGTYLISETLEVNADASSQSIRLVGAHGFTNIPAGGALLQTASRLMWGGSASDVMVQVNTVNGFGCEHLGFATTASGGDYVITTDNVIGIQYINRGTTRYSTIRQNQFYRVAVPIEFLDDAGSGASDTNMDGHWIVQNVMDTYRTGIKVNQTNVYDTLIQRNSFFGNEDYTKYHVHVVKGHCYLQQCYLGKLKDAASSGGKDGIAIYVESGLVNLADCYSEADNGPFYVWDAAEPTGVAASIVGCWILNQTATLPGSYNLRNNTDESIVIVGGRIAGAVKQEPATTGTIEFFGTRAPSADTSGLEDQVCHYGSTLNGLFGTIGTSGVGRATIQGTQPRLDLYNTGTSLTGSVFSGDDTPEGALTAPVGCLYLRTNGGANTTLYVKESGAGNTGWVAK